MLGEYLIYDLQKYLLQKDLSIPINRDTRIKVEHNKAYYPEQSSIGEFSQ